MSPPYSVLGAVALAGTALAGLSGCGPTAQQAPQARQVQQTQQRDCGEVLASAPQLSMFASGATRTGLMQNLRYERGSPVTIFAPTDEALRRVNPVVRDAFVPPGGAEAQQPAPGLLPNAVNAHVVSGLHRSSELTPGTRLQSVNNSPIEVVSGQGSSAVLRRGAGGPRVGPQIRPQDTRIVRADIPCTNGVIHAIDHPLLR